MYRAPCDGAIDQISPAHIGLFFVILALGIYVFSNPARLGWYDHFVWQADAFLHGRVVIAWPGRAVRTSTPTSRT